jgi:hypothetical protein
LIDTAPNITKTIIRLDIVIAITDLRDGCFIFPPLSCLN